MRTKHTILGTLMIVLLVACHATGQSLRWESNLERAAAQAATSNRLVLVHFWAPWCTSCLKMEQEVFSHPEVQAAIDANYVPVRLNVEHNQQLAQRYGIERLPTDVVVTPQGRLIERQIGSMDRFRYVSRLHQIVLNARRQTTVAASVPQPNVPQPNVPRPNVPVPPQGPVAPPTQWPPQQQQYAPPAPVASIPGGPAPRFGGPSDNVAAPPANIRGAAQANIPQQPAGTPWPGPGSVAQAPTQPPANWQTPRQDSFAGPADPRMAQQQQQPVDHYQPPVNHPPIHQGPQAGPAPGGAMPGGQPMNQTVQAPTQRERLESAPVHPPMADQPAPPMGPPNSEACPFAMEGYCPVELTENKNWKLGDVRWGANHRGQTYLFSGPEQQQRFMQDPDRYSPVASGIDVVLALSKREIVPGRREHGVFCGDRVFLFSNEETLAAFKADTDRFIAELPAIDQTFQGVGGRQ